MATTNILSTKKLNLAGRYPFFLYCPRIPEIFLSLFLLACLTTSHSCIDDKGNYEYIELSTAVMEAVNSSNSNEDVYVYTTPNANLYIDPGVSFTEGKGYGDYSFEWHNYEINYNNTLSVISRSDSPILDITLPPSMNKSGTYHVLFIAKNNQTQVKFTKRYVIVVINTMQVGYLALTEKSDGMELELIANFRDTLTLYPDLLQLTESEYPRIGRKPICLALFYDTTAPSPYDKNSGRVKYSVYIVTDKGTDRLKPEDYSFVEHDYNIGRVSVIDDKFLPANGLIPEKMLYNFGIYSHYIYLNNHWFFANRTPVLYLFMDPINTPYGQINYYTPSPYMVNLGQGAMLYDMDHNRFMRHGYNSSSLNLSTNTLCTYPMTDVDGEPFKFNDTNYDLTYMGPIDQSNSAYATGFGILRHKTTEKHEIWTFRLTNSAATKTNRYNFPTSLDYGSIKYFAHHPSAQYLYCATEERIYALTMNQENPVVIDVSDIVPAGHKISLLKAMFPNKGAVKPDSFCYFALGTYKPGEDLDTCGTLGFYEIDEYTGRFTLSKHPKIPPADGYRISMQWSGLGKIVDVDYKAM